MQSSGLHAILRVLIPSFFSAWVCAIASAVIVTVLTLPPLYKKLGIDSYFVALKEGQVRSDVFSQYEYVNATINSSTAAANTSTFVVWAVIGLTAYVIILSLFKLFKNFIDFIRLISYTTVDRKDVAEEVLIHLLIRCSAIGLIVGFQKVFMVFLLPTLLIIASNVPSLMWPQAILYTLLALVILFFSLHLAVIALRLVMVRTRVFFGKDSTLH